MIVAAYAGGTLVVARSDLYVQGLVLVAAVFGILAVSLDLVAGMTGLYSLGHAGLFAFGAYGTALLSQDYGLNDFVLLPIAVLGVGAIGLLLGVLSLRVSGLYFAVTTFVFTLVVSTVVGELAFTRGPQGVLGPLFPNFPGGLGGLGSSVAWGVMLALLVAVAVVWSIRRSPLYGILLAIRDAEPFAASTGVNTSLVKVGVVGLSASMVGLAGWAFSFLGVVSPGQFSWSVTVNILVMVLLGGINTTVGPVIGAAFISIYPAWVNISPLWQECLIAAIFLLVVVVFPNGVIGLLRAVGRLLARHLVESKRPTSTVHVEREPTVPAGAALAAGEGGAARREPAHIAAAARRLSARKGDEVVVECRGITFNYVEGVRVLNGVDFRVKRGTLHGLIGPNGSGKSTLVDLIAGRLKPLSGTIALHGRRIESLGPHARAHAGMMRTFQSAVLVNELACRDNVGLGLYTHIPRIATRAPMWPALPRARRDLRTMLDRSEATLDWIGARSWSGLSVGQVPHGIQQLTQVAAASVGGPSVLILDELFAGLAAGEVENLQNILIELRESGVSIILIEHQTRVVFALCDEVTVLSAGEVIATGAAASVFEDDRVREVYLGR